MLVFSAAALVPFAFAQNPDTLMPDASTARAKQVLQQLTDALGGPSYLEVRESACEGRLARFGHAGELNGFTNFKVYWRYPDKNRTDYTKKGLIINLYNGDRGWTLDRGGVSELSDLSVAEFQSQVKKDIHNLLRLRMNEPGLSVRYAGTDILDLKTVDWVEITDAEQRIFRLAVDQTSHLLVRSVVIVDDDVSQQRTQDTNIYSNFQRIDGVMTPLQITTDRNGRRINQVFFAACRYNPGFTEDFFTKAALDKHFRETGGKQSKADKKKGKEEN
jgi:outer membrane lipoprotein-sorting protein